MHYNGCINACFNGVLYRVIYITVFFLQNFLIIYCVYKNYIVILYKQKQVSYVLDIII